jgi:hypothetical protein
MSYLHLSIIQESEVRTKFAIKLTSSLHPPFPPFPPPHPSACCRYHCTHWPTNHVPSGFGTILCTYFTYQSDNDHLDHNI